MSFNCDFCKKNYKSYKTLWNHNNTFHKEEIASIKNKDKNFNCVDCNKKFTTKQNLQNHCAKACKNKNKVKTITKKEIINETKDSEINLLKKEIKEMNIMIKNIYNILVKKNMEIEV